jgi:hypothetical protein
MFVGRSRRVRVFLVMAVVAALSLAACGGGDDDDSASKSSNTTTADDNVSTTKASTGNGDCFGTPGDQTARVRFVNLYTNSTYAKGDIDVYSGFGAGDPCGEKLATVAYGEASDYLDVKALDQDGNWSTTAYVGGSTDDDNGKIINQTETWKGGEQVTIVFYAQDPESGNPPSFGSDQAFFEKVADEEGGSSGSVPEAQSGKAWIGINASSLQYSVKDAAWQTGADGVDGCLAAVNDTESGKQLVGGTQLVEYQVDPGSLDLSLHPSDPGTCSGTPDIGPVTVDAQAGSRTYVFAYGTGPDDLHLLVLPVDA